MILLAIVLVGAVLVAFRQEDQRQARLDRLAAAAPQIAFDLFRIQRQGGLAGQSADLVRLTAQQQDVRILLVDRTGAVTIDTEDSLKGKRLDIPPPGEEHAGRTSLTYRTWQGTTPETRQLVFLTPRGPLERLPQGPGAGARLPQIAELSERVVLAVPSQTLTRAWLDLLPGLAWAGAIALAGSVIIAVLIARGIAQPLAALTRASEAMARGDYDQTIALRRNDEVGRLALAFNEMARQVSRSHQQMRSLIANVSHDLKTPLTSVLGFAQALRDGAVAGEAAGETGGIIHEEARRMQAMVEDLLYLSEIDAGQVVLTREPVDVGALVGRALRRLDERLRARSLTLTTALAEGLVVEGDAAKLERVLDNVLDNAVKYTPIGGRVEIQGRLEGSAPPALRLDVFNSGSVIAAEDLPRIFDRFFRVDRARTRANGSGLGLPIARELAELHGGALTAVSNATGTTFTLRLPVTARSLPSAPARLSVARPLDDGLTPRSA